MNQTLRDVYGDLITVEAPRIAERGEGAVVVVLMQSQEGAEMTWMGDGPRLDALINELIEYRERLQKGQ